jgi:S-DNA-T family DNA segregation ATPase FtsK/SpoIIIE
MNNYTESVAKERHFPSSTLLKEDVSQKEKVNTRSTKAKLEEILSNLKIDGHVTKVSVGPSVTQYEITLEPGVRADKVEKNKKAITEALEVSSIRLVIPIPGKNALGIQVPNKTATPVYMRSLLESKEWNESRAAVPVLLGQDMEGKTAILDFAKAPHLLVAGDAKSEVSACLNTIILSLLFKFSPNELTFLILAPKSGPLSVFGRIPHMLVPIVSEPKEYVPTLRWAADEVDRRYKVLAKVKAKNLTAFNSRLADSQLLTDDNGNVIPQKLPVLVIIISELADVMATESADREDAETCICRIAQNGRAVGIHLVIATHSPRKEVVTALIKANFPARIAFRVDDIKKSRLLLDTKGAENLLGNGDMLFNPPDGSPLKRIQSPFVSEDEVSKVVAEVRKQSEEQQ